MFSHAQDYTAELTSPDTRTEIISQISQYKHTQDSPSQRRLGCDMRPALHGHEQQSARADAAAGEVVQRKNSGTQNCVFDILKHRQSSMFAHAWLPEAGR